MEKVVAPNTSPQQTDTIVATVNWVRISEVHQQPTDVQADALNKAEMSNICQQISDTVCNADNKDRAFNGTMSQQSMQVSAE